MLIEEAIRQKIQAIIDENCVVLFMKGTADFPQCGFSGKVVHLLRELEVSFKTVNVLEDAGIRSGIKAFSQWPTIPQLYVKGQFVGGCDIVTELYQNGQLAQQLEGASS